jgi:hypothetical protein
MRTDNLNRLNGLARRPAGKTARRPSQAATDIFSLERSLV